MLTLPAATARITRHIQATESALDVALVEASALFHSVALAAQDIADAPVVETHAALLRGTKTLEGILSARADATRLHSQLKGIGREMMAGEEPYCPPAKGSLVDAPADIKVA